MARRALRVEALASAVLRHGGMSWDAMAGRREVTRQSLHRRLSARSDREAEAAQRYAGLHSSDFYERLERLESMIARLNEDFDEELAHAPAIWEARRKTPGWWWRAEEEDE
ncbi:hypothetical protein CK936_26470 [Streptomyces albireticuli]|uniref:Uncharacterized protein n=2 Tax=Streptomyces albireticuli TaxID=1940 RepID=A0A2A2D3G1_9ACTN|nr:hypothetical protein CK936_26470 [Streptomyces albireticuli]